jgi:hypothetical protein
MVQFHLSNVFGKLAVTNRTAATQHAREHGLTDATDTPSRNRRPGLPLLC